MAKATYKPTIGMEVHVELKTKTKMFCSCSNDPLEKEPNKNICPICLGHPGTLPTINKKAVEMVIQVGKALNCRIAEVSKFDRKNYFYPDLPKGYQISQYDLPLTFGGYLEIGGKKVGITRVHLEEDAGRLVHPEGASYSLIDFNRAGIPLLELVSEPDIESPAEAKKFCQELQRLFRYLNVSDADIERGQMRCEANISLKKENSSKLGNKVEMKNLGSFRAVEESIIYEMKRQEELLSKGGSVSQETRGWDAERRITFSQRLKEGSSDYRYFPEPDLPLIETKSLDLDNIFASIPELPWQKRERFKEQFPALGAGEIETLIEDRFGAQFFEESVSEAKAYLADLGIEEGNIVKTVANFLLTDLRFLMAEHRLDFPDLNMSPKNFGNLIAKFLKGDLSSKLAKSLLKELFLSGKDIEDAIRDEGAVLIADEEELGKLAREVIEENRKTVDDYKKGKSSALQFLIGQLMAKTKGKAEPKRAGDIFKKLLSSQADIKK